ncbi:GIY-YIG nuclease family protein [[Mycoplasma] mobile]|uniref:Excinuclease ABC nuclease subunit C n=1 Tax=Mycoplasma mobile (strain ATCC 43663 / 163K / NCTC 11711) TaxID=267748 RepID=Q6KH99_MYCM1|nr:GIY-YIG nuclease family protein [[Mycoplasma] mobile]AAT28031.1 excinuclease ABC nuclease subunit C [Mycoplasma mobile 163K]
MNKTLDLDNVTTKPGVYLWKNKHGNIVYVGKAKNLRSRMKQYFSGMLNSYKTIKLVQIIDSYEVIVTTSEKEALILERNLIETHKPSFNILLIDDKRYPYIKISLLKNDIEIKMVRRYKKQNNSFYYGPFPTGFGAKVLINLLIRETKFEKGLPVVNKNASYWKEQFKKVKNILGVNNKEYINDLKKQMFLSAENFQFEIANEIKSTILFLEELKNNQVVELKNDKNIDVIGFSEDKNYIFLNMLFYRYGALLSSEDFVLEKLSDGKETIRKFINEYYTLNLLPDELIISLEFTHNDLNFDFEILNPKRGTYKNILDNAIMSANEKREIKILEFERKKEITINNIEKLEELLETKNLNHFLVIDNSNTNNFSPVSVIISYKNGLKDKKNYKKFNLETGDRKADVEYMKEACFRYFSKKENPIPDLLIVDGALAQVREVKKILASLFIKLKVIGLVKNDKHITSHIINLKEKREEISDASLLIFLKSIQEEVDRFAKFHHRSLRTKNTLEGFLLSIKGIGPKTEKKLLENFKNYSEIYNASLEDLEKILSKSIAKTLYEKIKKNIN